MKSKLKERVEVMKVELFRSNGSRLGNHPRCKRRSGCWDILYNFYSKLITKLDITYYMLFSFTLM